MKQHRNLAMIASAALMLSMQLPVSAGSIGDTDGSGSVDATDAAKMLIRAAEIGAGSLADADETALMDINGDGAITAVDASHLLTYAARTGAGETLPAFDEYVAQRREAPVLYGSDSSYQMFSNLFVEFESSSKTGHVITSVSELEEFAKRLDRCGFKLYNAYDEEWFETGSLFVMLTRESCIDPWYEATAITEDENNNLVIAMTYYLPIWESPMTVDRVTVVETNKAIDFAASITIDKTTVIVEDFPESE